jgi:hypothetical protein
MDQPYFGLYRVKCLLGIPKRHTIAEDGGSESIEMVELGTR